MYKMASEQYPMNLLEEACFRYKENAAIVSRLVTILETGHTEAFEAVREIGKFSYPYFTLKKLTYALGDEKHAKKLIKYYLTEPSNGKTNAHNIGIIKTGYNPALPHQEVFFIPIGMHYFARGLFIEYGPTESSEALAKLKELKKILERKL